VCYEPEGYWFYSRWGIGFFNWPNPSSRTICLESTQSLKEMSTRNLPEGKGRQARKTVNPTAICEPIVYKMWEPRRLTTLWASTACYRHSFTFYLYKNPPLVSILSQMNPVYISILFIQDLSFVLSSHLRLGLPGSFLSLLFSFWKKWK
jgi:hypothetical protein